MQKISIQVEIDFKDILEAATNLEVTELEKIVHELNELLEPKKLEKVSSNES